MTQTADFLAELNNALAASSRHFSPDGIYHGEAGALRLAREIGTALADSPDKEADDAVQNTYSAVLVRHTMGRAGGVPINAKPWFAEMRRALAAEREKRDARRAR